MKSFEASAIVAAGPAAAWTALSNVTDWPNWTESMTTIEGPPAAITTGQAYTVKQPGMPRMVWTVSEVDDGHGFSWTAPSPGVTTVGRHWISTDGLGGTRIHLSVEQTGPLARLIGALTGRRTRRYLQMEADGLAAASSGGPP